MIKIDRFKIKRFIVTKDRKIIILRTKQLFHAKNDFIPKNLTRYKSENNFMDHQNNYVVQANC